MPTLAPGDTRVPRWRTMMLPPTTCSPPHFFTPRRRPAESRPLREEPPAFLCAISYYSGILFGGRFGRGLLDLGRGSLLGRLLVLAADRQDAQQSQLLAVAVLP